MSQSIDERDRRWAALDKAMTYIVSQQADDARIQELEQSASESARHTAQELRKDRDELAIRLDSIRDQAKPKWDEFQSDVEDSFQRLENRADRLGGTEHPDLDRVDPDVLGDGPDLFDDEVAGDGMDACDADRVLRRQRGDRGHSVDAAAGERLQVGLDAGTAT